LRFYSLLGGLLLISLLFFTLLRISQLKNRNLIIKQSQDKQKQRIKELIKEKELEAINAMMEGQENERTRIARDLHDRLGGTLSIVKMHFKSVEESIEVLKEKNVKQYKEANNLLDEACNEVRKIAHDMTSGVLMKFGLLAALEALKETVEKADRLKLNLIDIGLEDRLSYAYEINIYRIIQELLTNTVKHANASEMNIQLFRKQQSLSIVVDDNGVGFNTEDKAIPKGIGLKNIESRVHKFNGEINIDSGKGAGTTITIDLPLNEEKP
jgi:signal transduction histidine kinase